MEGEADKSCNTTTASPRRQAELSTKITKVKASIQEVIRAEKEHYNEFGGDGGEIASERHDLLKEAERTNTSYKRALTTFNDLKDAAMQMLELYATRQGRTLKEELEVRGIEVDE